MIQIIMSLMIKMNGMDLIKILSLNMKKENQEDNQCNLGLM